MLNLQHTQNEFKVAERMAIDEFTRMEEVCYRNFEIFQAVLQSQIVDQIAGMPDIGSDASRILDSNWLYLGLDTFFNRRIYCKFNPSAEHQPKIVIPASVDALIYWGDPKNCPSDMQLIAVAQNQIDPWQNLEMVFEPYFFQAAIGTKQKFLSFVESSIRTLARLHVRRRPRVCLMGLHNLVRKDSIQGLLKYLIQGGGLFGDNDSSPVPISNINSDLRKKFRDSFESFFNSKKILTTSDRRALANYLSVFVPISHLEQRSANWSRAQTQTQHYSSQSKVFTAIGLFFSTYHIYLSAALKQGGATITGIQHGGYYGYMRNHGFSEAIEMQCQDYFLTWGWDKPHPKSKRAYKAKLDPVGSFYLHDLQKKFRDKEITIKNRALFCPIDFSPRPIRLEIPLVTDFLATKIWPYSAEIMARWLKMQNLGLDLKPQSAHFCEGAHSTYAKILIETCKRFDVDVKLVDLKALARELMGDYQCVIWDTIGTGFWESTSIGRPTFLTPAARIFPLREGEIGELSELFFLDNDTQMQTSIETRYQAAMAESAKVIERFGKSASEDIFVFLSKEI